MTKDPKLQSTGSEAKVDPLASQRTTDGALLLPFAGLLLLGTPFLSVFANVTRFFGIPGSVTYVFLVWSALIGLAFYISRKLRNKQGHT